MESPRSIRIGLWLESLAYGIGAATSILAGLRVGGVGYFLIAGTALILGALVIWTAQDPSALVGGGGSLAKRLTRSALAVIAIVFLLVGTWLNVSA